MAGKAMVQWPSPVLARKFLLGCLQLSAVSFLEDLTKTVVESLLQGVTVVLMYFIYTFFLEVQTRYTSNVLFF